MNNCILTAQVIDYRSLSYSKDLNMIQIICRVPNKKQSNLLIFNSLAFGQISNLLQYLLINKSIVTFEGLAYIYNGSKLWSFLTNIDDINSSSYLFIYFSKIY